ncbi:MAG: SDR family NAD(P)-dependent oxidoreductase [Thaumarchaeota archaeon]|nr:SDR family NAD(P)-dependent oxidoreductase [Nitrososphaerota archaeon]
MKYLGRTALITGSGTGIGKAIATAFVREGASVIILGRRREPLEETAGMLREIAAGNGSGATVTIFSGVDVSDERGVVDMFDSIREAGTTVHYVINNAGVSGPVTCFPNASMSDFAGTVAIHLTGTFWVSVCGLSCMERGGKIVTISTFFTEERPLEQRPYRFRGPYTASQGAKNRLAEAMSWELVDDGIASIATNPGPVHSDRIYKTVYPKAAAEFMRVGGFEALDPVQVESACADILPLLGEDDSTVQAGLDSAAAKISDVDDARGVLERLLQKIQSIAEKVQRNTSHMIADRQFLSQDQVATTVLNLCAVSISGIVNGKVIPGDRVFYPVRPHVATAAPPSAADYGGGCVVIVLGSGTEADARSAAALASHVIDLGGRVVLLTPHTTEPAVSDIIKDLHVHRADAGDAEQIGRWLRAASEKMGPVLAVVHMTGDVPDGSPLVKTGRQEWDAMVARFINTPAVVVQESLKHFVPGGGSDPRKFAGAKGRVMIVGPGLPRGRKVSGAQRARAEVFRGALRPFATTINQELADVLKSDARVFAVLPGSVSGGDPDPTGVAGVLDYLMSASAARSGEVIFCPDESR